MKVLAALILPPCLGLALPARGQNPLWSLHGRGLLDAVGTSVAGTGDLDGDGHGDFLAGAPQSALLGGTGFARVYSGRSGKVVYEVAGAAAGDGFGVSVGAAGDVDADGTPDFLVGATPLADRTTKPGYVRVYSGKSGKLLREVRGRSAGSWFGAAVQGCGDIDRDGRGDFVVGAPRGDQVVRDTGLAFVYSGRTFALLYTFRGARRNDRFGFAVAGAGDVDKDGWADVVVGAYLDDTAALDSGAAFVYSGRTGARIRTFTGQGRGDGFGFSVAGAGDVDRDGYADVLVGALWDDPSATDAGSAWLFSGKTGFALHRFTGEAAFDGMGTSVAGAGDLDGDGVPDVVAGAIQAFPPGRAGYLRLWSGRDFKELFTVRGGAAGDWFGHSVAAAGDVNKDGFPDLVAGASHASVRGARGGSCWVFAGRHLGLRANRTALSLATGGLQILTLDARPVHAGKLYFLLGTSGTTAPGLPLGRVTLPLAADSYFLLTLLAPNTPLLRLTLGKLDGRGRATAFFRLPPGLPASLAGLTLHHAFTVFAARGVDFDFASNPVPVRILR